MSEEIPEWIHGYNFSQRMTDQEWLVAHPLTFGRGRVGIVTWDGWTGDFY